MLGNVIFLSLAILNMLAGVMDVWLVLQPHQIRKGDTCGRVQAGLARGGVGQEGVGEVFSYPCHHNHLTFITDKGLS